MKKIIIIIGLALITPFAFSQTNTEVMKGDFKLASANLGRTTGYGTFQSYSSGDVKGSQFFYPTWANGSVTTTNNEVISNNYKFLFDKVRHELFIIYKPGKEDPKEVLQAEKSQLKSFSINTDKDHVFAPGRVYGTENPTDFYEVLSKNDSGYTLLKYIKTSFVKFDTRDIEKVKRGDMYDEFVDKTTYYVAYKTANPQKIGANKEKSVVGAFPTSKKAVVENYFNNHSQQDVNDDFLTKLVETVNQ